jgi:hypothetical protein
MSDSPLLLIVRQRPAPHAELDQLVGELQRGFSLDPYATRQRLLGPGLAQLAQGGTQTLAGPAATLRRHGYACWVTAPPRPAFTPPRLRSLTIGAAAVDFLCEGDHRVRLERGGAAVGVLADLSGELAGRQAKTLLARNAYLGREQARVFTAAEIRQAVLKGQPAFDCYLLDAAGAVAAAIRVLPGRFSPEGLGGRASLAAVRNLEAVLDLVDEYAGSFRLHVDFGLSQLPGCQPQPLSSGPGALLGNLDALTRYGWLVSALAEPAANRDDAFDPASAPGLAAGLAGATALATAGGTMLAVDGLAAAFPAVADDLPAPAAGQAGSVPLPPPPERPGRPGAWRRQLPALAAFLGGVLLACAGMTDLLQPLLRQAVYSGLLPAAIALGLCWGAFACLRLKRRIEDTPTSRTRSLAMGLVEIHGRATRRYALVAPMTQAACVWYRLRKYRRDRSQRWQLSSESDSSHVPFALDDGSGQVVVDPAGATVKSNTRQTGYPGEGALIGAALEGGPDEKWVEELIYEGTSLYVLGYARPARGSGPGLRERTVELLRRLKLDPQALRRYDADGDGRLDPNEWQAARDEVERQAATEQLQAPAGPTGVQVLLGKPPRGLPFLIAEGQTGEELAGRYGWTGAVLLALGAAAFGVALKLALEFFHLL